MGNKRILILGSTINCIDCLHCKWIVPLSEERDLLKRRLLYVQGYIKCSSDLWGGKKKYIRPLYFIEKIKTPFAIRGQICLNFVNMNGDNEVDYETFPR